VDLKWNVLGPAPVNVVVTVAGEMSHVTDEEILALAVNAFQAVPRPARVNDCPCDECRELDELLSHRDNETLDASDLDFSEALLSTEALRFFMPGLIRLCLRPDAVADGGLYDNFVYGTLGQPVSKKKPPKHHPRFPVLTKEQSMAVLAFLEHLDRTRYDTEERPRELRRALDNWRHFVETLGVTSTPTQP
jgi:hypothetical protein